MKCIETAVQNKNSAKISDRRAVGFVINVHDAQQVGNVLQIPDFYSPYVCLSIQ